MRDRRIGHQALDIGLPDRGDGAKEHGRDRQEGQYLGPIGSGVSKGIMQDAGKQAGGGHFGRSGKKRGHRGGRTFVDIRRPHMERHSGHLESQTAT